MIEIQLRTLLEENCYRCAGLARRTGIPYPTMLRMYRGEARKIKLDDLEQLCMVLNCSITDILVQKEV